MAGRTKKMLIKFIQKRMKEKFDLAKSRLKSGYVNERFLNQTKISKIDSPVLDALDILVAPEYFAAKHGANLGTKIKEMKGEK